MFASIKYDDKEQVILKNATNESLKKTLDEAKKDYRVKEIGKVKNRNRETIGVLYFAKKKPKYIWES